MFFFVFVLSLENAISVPLGVPVGLAMSPLVGVEQSTAVRRVIRVRVVGRRPYRRQRNFFRVEQTVAVSRWASQTLGPSRFSHQHGSLLRQFIETS